MTPRLHAGRPAVRQIDSVRTDGEDPTSHLCFIAMKEGLGPVTTHCAPAAARSFGLTRWLRVLLAAGAIGPTSLLAAQAGSQGSRELELPRPLRSPFVETIDLDLPETTVPAVVAVMRERYCAGVSFIPAPGDQRLSLAVHGGSVEQVLQEIAAQKPVYRHETIGGHDVVYPATPEFQAVLGGVDVRQTGRFTAIYKYLPQLKTAVPFFGRLAGPNMVSFGGPELAFFSQPVSVRERGRVIDQLVDLLGANPRIYMTFVTAPSGVPAMDLGQVECQPVVPPVRFTSCFGGGEAGSAGDLLSRRIDLDAAGEPVAAVVERLRHDDHLPLSFVEGSAVAVTVHLSGATVRQALEKLLSQAPGYSCQIGNGHVVIAANDPVYRTMDRGVKVVPAPPCMAAQMYTDVLLLQPAFQHLQPFVDCLGEPSLVRDDELTEVALAAEGTVLEHLVQLLGRNPHAFFTIRWSHPPDYRTMSMGTVQ